MSSTVHAFLRTSALHDRLLTAGRLGVPPDALVRLHDEGALVRLAPGVYLGADHEQHVLSEAAAWSVRHPHAVVGLLTAAAEHDLTDAFEGGTWLMVPKGSSPPRSRHAAVFAVQVVERWLDRGRAEELGLVRAEVHGECLWLTTADRTVVDLWRYPRRVSVEHALEALRRRVEAPDFRLADLARLARRLRVWGRLEPVVQGVMLR